jgi:diguanylate cyclase (GGDEF)-like protein/PAS domain S-box-containing protein
MGTELEGPVPCRSASSEAGGHDESTPELLADRNHYRRVLQSLSEGVFVQDRTGKVLSVNGAAARILGFDLGNLPGHTTAGLAWDIVDENGDAVAAEDRPGRRCIETGQPTIGQLFGVGVPGGGRKWIEIDARPLCHTGDDVPYAVVSTVRDVTDRASARRATAAAEHRHQLVLANAVEGYHIVDADGMVLEAGQTITAGSELVDDAGRMTFSRLDPADRRAMNDVVAHVLARPGETLHADVRMRGVSGPDCWLEFSVTNHLDDPAVQGIVVNHRDVTARRAAEDSIRFQAELLDAAGQAIIGTDRRGRILFWNKVATRMYGWARDEVVGRYVPEVLPPIASEDELREMADCVARGDTWSGDLWVTCKDRTLLQVFMTTTPLFDAAGTFLAAVGVSTDITERKLAESELARLALHDPLTDLPNRVLLVTQLDERLRRREEHGDAVAVLFIDLDRFKVINDGIGHQTGDEVLRSAAKRLAAAFPDEFIARFGGDEFVVLHAAATRIDTDVLAARVHTVFERPIAVHGYELFLTASVGVAHATDSDTSDTLLRDADAAMYEAKAGGRSRTTVFDETLRKRATRRLDWENSLRHALDRSEFRLVYQPIVSLADGVPVGFEALLRWDHPTLGSVSPADFIPVAEDTGAIVEIGAWVIAEAVGQLGTWDREHGRDALWMTVNVSTRQLATPSLVGIIQSALTTAGITPARLHLEITETALILDDDRSIETLQTLRDMGVRLAIDDFGTGYSSLTYLKRLPINVLKIDRSFVDGLGTDPNDTSIVRMILSLAAALDLTAIAEGVETELQLEALHQYGCELGQGYLWSPGLPPDELVAWLDRTPAAARNR